MCGIVGVSFHQKYKIEDQNLRRRVAMYLFTRLLNKTKDRGDDATGLGVLYANGWWMTLRDAVASDKFILGIRGSEDKTREIQQQEVTYANLMQATIEGYTNQGQSDPMVIMGHCRKKTQGSEYNMVNNHPITIPENDIIMVHNGSIKNDKTIIKKLKSPRIGEVDSEALARLFEHEVVESAGVPLTLNNMYNIGYRLDGSAAALMATSKEPTKLFGLKESRPLVLYYEKNLGIIFYVSDQKFMHDAIADFQNVLISLAPDLIGLEFGTEEISERSAFIVDLTKPVDKAITATDYPFSKDPTWSEPVTTSHTSNSNSSTQSTYKEKSLYSVDRMAAREEAKAMLIGLETTSPDDTIPDFKLSGEKVENDPAYEFAGGSESNTKVNSKHDLKDTPTIEAGEAEEMSTIDLGEEGIIPTDNKMSDAEELSDLYRASVNIMLKKFGTGKSVMSYPMSSKEIAKMLEVTEEELKSSPTQAIVAAVFQLAAKTMFVEGYQYYITQNDTSNENISNIVRALRLLLLSSLIVEMENTSVARTTDNVKELIDDIKEAFIYTTKSEKLTKIGLEFLNRINDVEIGNILSGVEALDKKIKDNIKILNVSAEVVGQEITEPQESTALVEGVDEFEDGEIGG